MWESRGNGANGATHGCCQEEERRRKKHDNSADWGAVFGGWPLAELCVLLLSLTWQNKVLPDATQDGFVATEVVLHQGTWCSSSQVKIIQQTIITGMWHPQHWFGLAVPIYLSDVTLLKDAQHDSRSWHMFRDSRLYLGLFILLVTLCSCASIAAQSTGNPFLHLYFIFALKRAEVLIVWVLIPLALMP